MRNAWRVLAFDVAAPLAVLLEQHQKNIEMVRKAAVLEKKGDATFIRPSHRSRFSAWRRD